MKMADDLFIYFDGVEAFGHLSGAIQIEIFANTLIASQDDGLQVRRVTTGHLRCSPAAAADLANAIAKALEMLEKASNQPAGTAIN